MAEVLGEQHDPALPQPLHQSSSRKRKLLPASLPSETRTLSLAETACPECGGELNALGCDISEQLELISSAFKVIETRRPKLACCSCDHIVQAPMPSKPIERCYAGLGLLARIVTAKFAEHTPHYRQSEIYRRQGLELSRATLGRWTRQTARESIHSGTLPDAAVSCRRTRTVATTRCTKTGARAHHWSGLHGASLCTGTYPGLTGKPAARSAAVENRSHICISVNTVWM